MGQLFDDAKRCLSDSTGKCLIRTHWHACVQEVRRKQPSQAAASNSHLKGTWRQIEEEQGACLAQKSRAMFWLRGVLRVHCWPELLGDRQCWHGHSMEAGTLRVDKAAYMNRR